MIQRSGLTKKMVQHALKSGCIDKIYGEEVNRLIREKYSQSEEMAIHRHYLMGQNTLEFDEYYAYCEDCKMKAKATISAFSEDY